jgi:hypothetical protein
MTEVSDRNDLDVGAGTGEAAPPPRIPVVPAGRDEEVAPEEEERHRRLRARWVGGGFVIGVAVALILGAVQVALAGWHVVPYMLIWHLVWCPYLGAVIGYNRCPAPRVRLWSWRSLRVRTRTLMYAIAYVALLCGVGTTLGPLGTRARQYHAKSVSSASLAKIFREQVQKSAADSRFRLGNAAALREGKIPEGLLPIQKDFLRSLDQTATPDYRKYRYGLIMEGEERLGKMQERNVVVFEGLADYHEQLSEKYDRAQWRPWRPVAPDPPPPPNQ